MATHPTLTIVNPPAAAEVPSIYQYTDKSFVVVGNTKPYKDALMAVHGKYNPNLKDPTNPAQKAPGFIFSNKQLPAVQQLLQQIQTGAVQPVAATTPRRGGYAGRGARGGYGGTTPTRVAPAAPVPPANVRLPGDAAPIKVAMPTIEYQTVTYRVVKPAVDMKANIIRDGTQTPTTVIMVNPGKENAIDTVYVQDDKQPDSNYQLGIVNGDWKVIGLLEPHSVTFTL